MSLVWALLALFGPTALVSLFFVFYELRSSQWARREKMYWNIRDLEQKLGIGFEEVWHEYQSGARSVHRRYTDYPLFFVDENCTAARAARRVWH